MELGAEKEKEKVWTRNERRNGRKREEKDDRRRSSTAGGVYGSSCGAPSRAGKGEGYIQGYTSRSCNSGYGIRGDNINGGALFFYAITIGRGLFRFQCQFVMAMKQCTPPPAKRPSATYSSATFGEFDATNPPPLPGSNTSPQPFPHLAQPSPPPLPAVPQLPRLRQPHYHTRQHTKFHHGQAPPS